MPAPVPQKAAFWTNMVEWAGYLKSWFAANQPETDSNLAQAYYDGEAVAYKVKDHDSGNSTWDSWIQDEFDAYVTYYVNPNNGGVQGWRKFTDGPLEDILRNTSRKTTAITGLTNILANGAYQNANPGDDISTQEFSREVALAIVAFVNWQRAGNTLTPTQVTRRDLLLEYALGHVNIWINNLGTYCRPFMAGHTAKALAYYFIYVRADSRIVPAIKSLCDFLWTACWKGTAGAWGSANSFLYTDRTGSFPGNDPSADGFTAPDLNMMVAPMYGFIWWQTGIQLYRDRGDLVFQGGVSVYSGGVWVSGAELGTRSASNPSGKRFDQQLFWGDLYITWAENNPVSGPVVPPPDTGGGTPPPLGTPGVGLQGVPFIPYGAATFQGSKGCLIIPVKVTIAGGEENTIKLIYQAPADGYCAIIGCMYARKLAHKLTFSSQQVDLTEMDFPAGAGIGKGISPAQPLFLSNKGGDLSVKSDLAFGPILFYVMEFKSLRFQ